MVIFSLVVFLDISGKHLSRESPFLWPSQQKFHCVECLLLPQDGSVSDSLSHGDVHVVVFGIVLVLFLLVLFRFPFNYSFKQLKKLDIFNGLKVLLCRSSNANQEVLYLYSIATVPVVLYYMSCDS